MSQNYANCSAAVGVFGGGNHADGVSAVSSLMVEGAGHSGREVNSSLDARHFLPLRPAGSTWYFPFLKNNSKT